MRNRGIPTGFTPFTGSKSSIDSLTIFETTETISGGFREGRKIGVETGERVIIICCINLKTALQRGAILSN
jgi:hypothetical protein